MSLILFIVVVVVLVVLAMWLVSVLNMIPPTPRMILNALIIVAGIIVIGQHAGLF